MIRTVLRNGDEKTAYDWQTYIISRQPWGLFVGGKAICPDGKARRLKRIASTADTFFSIPAAVEVYRNGIKKTVSGYVTFRELDGSNGRFIEFVPVNNRKNADWAFPKKHFIKMEDFIYSSQCCVNRGFRSALGVSRLVRMG